MFKFWTLIPNKYTYTYNEYLMTMFCCFSRRIKTYSIGSLSDPNEGQQSDVESIFSLSSTAIGTSSARPRRQNSSSQQRQLSLIQDAKSLRYSGLKIAIIFCFQPTQTCFCQPSRMSHFGELPDVVCQKLLKKFKKK